LSPPGKGVRFRGKTRKGQCLSFISSKGKCGEEPDEVSETRKVNFKGSKLKKKTKEGWQPGGRERRKTVHVSSPASMSRKGSYSCEVVGRVIRKGKRRGFETLWARTK